MTPQERSAIQIQSELYAYFDQMRFARAAELARLKRYLEAESILAPEGRISGNPQELDLLARISAQQHAYERACLLWEAALQRSPGNADYQQSIEHAKAAEKRYVAFQKKIIYGLFLVSLCTLGLAIWSLLHWHTPPPIPSAPGNTTPANAAATPPPAPSKTELPPTASPAKAPTDTPTPPQSTTPPDSAKPPTPSSTPVPSPTNPTTTTSPTPPKTDTPTPAPAPKTPPDPSTPSQPTPDPKPEKPPQQ